MLIVRILATNIRDRILATKTRQRIHVAIRIVARQVAALDPKDTLQAKHVFQVTLQLLLPQILVTVHGSQALDRRHQRALPIRLDAASLQHERLHIRDNHLLREGAHPVQLASYQIIEASRVLHAPTVKHEVVHHGRPLVEDRDTPMVARPRIVRIHHTENDPTVVHLS